MKIIGQMKEKNAYILLGDFIKMEKRYYLLINKIHENSRSFVTVYKNRLECIAGTNPPKTISANQGELKLPETISTYFNIVELTKDEFEIHKDQYLDQLKIKSTIH